MAPLGSSGPDRSQGCSNALGCVCRLPNGWRIGCRAPSCACYRPRFLAGCSWRLRFLRPKSQPPRDLTTASPGRAMRESKMGASVFYNLISEVPHDARPLGHWSVRSTLGHVGGACLPGPQRRRGGAPGQPRRPSQLAPTDGTRRCPLNSIPNLPQRTCLLASLCTPVGGRFSAE